MKNMHKGLVAETYQETFNRMCSVFLEWQKILLGILKKLEDLCKFVTTIEKQQLKTCMKLFFIICIKGSMSNDLRTS